MVGRDIDDDHQKNAVMEKTKNGTDTAPAEGVATVAAETVHRECSQLGRAAGYLNVLGGLICSRSKISMRGGRASGSEVS